MFSAHSRGSKGPCRREVRGSRSAQNTRELACGKADTLTTLDNSDTEGTEDRDIEDRDTEDRNTEGRDTEGRDTEGRDTEGRDTEGRDTEDRDTENQIWQMQKMQKMQSVQAIQKTQQEWYGKLTFIFILGLVESTFIPILFAAISMIV